MAVSPPSSPFMKISPFNNQAEVRKEIREDKGLCNIECKNDVSVQANDDNKSSTTNAVGKREETEANKAARRVFGPAIVLDLGYRG